MFTTAFSLTPSPAFLRFIKKSAITLNILSAALKFNAKLLIDLIAGCYYEKPVELLRYLAPCADLCYFQKALINVKKRTRKDFGEILISVAASLLSCKLNKALLMLIKMYRQQLFADNRFKNWLSRNKNPTVLLACLKWGFDCSQQYIISTAAFAWLIGDKDSSIQLVNYTTLKDHPEWQACVQQAHLSQNNIKYQINK